MQTLSKFANSPNRQRNSKAVSPNQDLLKEETKKTKKQLRAQS
jgi:hypothetical protein